LLIVIDEPEKNTMKNIQLVYRWLILFVFSVCLSASAQAQVPSKVTTQPASKTQIKPTDVRKPATVVTTSPGTSIAPATRLTAAHSISGVNPEKAPGGTEVIISGQKFGNVSSDVRVWVNGKAAIIKGISDDQIQIVVPIKAGSGPISVQVKNQTATGAWFVYQWKATVSVFAGKANNHATIDGPASIARFNRPYSLRIDQYDNIYVKEQGGSIRMVSKFGDVSTVPSTTHPSLQSIIQPITSVVDARGTKYELPPFRGNTSVGMTGSIYIKKITTSGKVTIFAGSAQERIGGADGYGEAAVFADLQGIAIDRAGNLYVTEIDGMELMNHGDRIRMISSEGRVTTLAGGGSERIGRRGSADGIGVDALFSAPRGIVVDSKGDLFVAETGSSVIRKIIME
jgi:hypothetical protein